VKDNQQKQHNPYDELGLDLDPEEIKKHQAKQKAMHDKLDYLIHKVFHQTEAGLELIGIWQDALVTTPGFSPDMNQLEVGKVEGMKAFIRNIILTCRRVNKDE